MQHFLQFAGDNWLLFLLFFILLIAYMAVDGRLKTGNQKEVSPQDAAVLSNRHKVNIIDIRPEDAFKAGHIAGAKKFKSDDIEASLKQLKKAKDNPIVVVCQKGISAKKVAHKLTQDGYDAKILTGGMDAWKKAGMPIVTD